MIHMLDLDHILQYEEAILVETFQGDLEIGAGIQSFLFLRCICTQRSREVSYASHLARMPSNGQPHANMNSTRFLKRGVPPPRLASS